MSKKIIESYRKKLAAEDGYIISRGASLRIALCYPNTYSIGMANLGLHTMYELFNAIPDVVCERVFLPDRKELEEYEKSGTPLMSLETQSHVKGFDVVAFSISFETDYLNMARMLQLSGVPVWSAKRSEHHPLIVMGGAASFLNPEPIADFTDVIAVGEGEILAYQLVNSIFENDTKEDILRQLAQIGRGFYVPSFYDVVYNDDGTVFDDLRLERRRAGLPMRSLPRHVRYHLREGQAEARPEQIPGAAIELQQVHPHRTGKSRARVCWGAGWGERGEFFDRTHRIDLDSGETSTWQRAGATQLEPMFVPRPGGTADDDGVLLVPTLSETDETTVVGVVDARSMACLAELRAPQIVPFGFHAAFSPA